VGRENRGVEKTTYRGALWSVPLVRYYSGYQIKKNDLGRACVHAREKRDAYRVLVGKREGKRSV
jgi:hypothetical protein